MAIGHFSSYAVIDLFLWLFMPSCYKFYVPYLPPLSTIYPFDIGIKCYNYKVN